MAVRERLVVIGNGMVGLRVLDRMVAGGGLEKWDVTVFGAEPHPALDRVNLTDFLHGTSARQLELKGSDWYEKHEIKLHTGDPVVLVDREEKVVHSQSGKRVPYDRLVFATGSHAFRPEIPGGDLEGVYVYRSLSDLRRIRSRAAGCGSVLIIGGGLLGLEAAEAFIKLGLRTHVVERGSGLMSKQLPLEASRILQSRIQESGVVVHNAQTTESIERRGEELVVVFKSGTCVKVGMVVFATGIRPCDELARACGLEVGPRGGIQVNERLETSDPMVYAVGECAAFKGAPYGLVLPGYEMADVLAENLHGGAAVFREPDQSAILKLEKIEVAAVGEFQSECPSYSSEFNGTYRRISVLGGRIVGAIEIGGWTEISRVREVIRKRRRIWPWNINRFIEQGLLWRPQVTADPADWPETAEVCNCMGICKREIVAACREGASSVPDIAARTGASSVCGSCAPVVSRIIGAPQDVVVEPRGGFALGLVSLLCLLILVPIAAFEMPVSDSVQRVSKIESLWSDHFVKQVTGFALVGLSVLSMVLSLRKRIRRFSLGDFGHWRVLHAGIGVGTLLVLFLHTGLHLGHNLNFLLGVNFLLLAGIGGMAGLVTAVERSMIDPWGRWLRKGWQSFHVALTWPLPVLVFFHAFASYYY
ncbi:MAG: NAD(P)/FAD-dependent oxidoreductase [Verrucomicrobiae bacterium]|nr:NAD(P)/FAD-dependent oxidoreductase [Verrucomicrobiae bacterium]